MFEELHRRWRAGESIAVATVVATWRSAPQPPGAAMLVAADGTVTGSVSGGCVEADLYERARGVLDTGVPELVRYGVSDDEAMAVGLTCGGVLDVFVERVDPAGFPQLGAVAAARAAGRPVAVVTCVAADAGNPPGVVVPAGNPPATSVRADPAGRLGRRLVLADDRVTGSLGSERLDAAVAADAVGLLAAGRSGILRYGYDGQRRGSGVSLFVAAYASPPRMLVFGAIDFAAAVARIGAFLGYRVTVCDARPVFATTRRFPDADEVVVDWPHRYLRAELEAGRVDGRTVVCVLTHDPRFDVPLLALALRQPFAYVGAMGSRRTHDERRKRLREEGLDEAQLARLASPIGLDLGGRTPEETAVSVAAQIVAGRWGGTGRPLADLAGPIHHPGDAQPGPDAQSIGAAPGA
ncbi:XdhC family protein [Micromonospora krabiensis]|uniref:Xanthine dehydrogenase accessory factor n=1 Tax=Micromonospora krabiensis TaxID=307121 RepID=A0A1C3NDS4_9ACTN|nr:XdhC/CoxI family protein [Micromonospora krabiensis]SBV30742.1 xanthine dehydrogenase accessory factor [Micromonospora krabiensis]